MALNVAHACTGFGSGVIIFNGERILLFCEDVEFAIESEGAAVAAFKGHKKGSLYLTTHRIIFLSKNSRDALLSFSSPFSCLREVELEQPIFGANYIKGRVLAESGGGWEGRAKFKLWFNSGGAIEFGQAMLRAGQLASRNTAAPGSHGQQPPPYSGLGNYYPAPPPSYMPPTDPAYGWVPYATFPTPPPASGVYMTDAPPPYPGVAPATVAPYFVDPREQNGAFGVPPAYVGPYDPHAAYVPAGSAPIPSAPQQYDDVRKKKE